MGLDYLNKKTWHTGSIKNIEKVWIREQEERDKLKKLQEKKKRLLEERHNEELKKLQAEAGFIPKSHLDRMEWMYDWGNKVQQQQNQKSTEEFLLGKPIDDSSIKKPFLPTQHKEEISNQRCEQYSKLHDDPLFQIRMQEEKLKQEIKENPFEVRKILQDIENKKLKKKLKKLKKSKKSKNQIQKSRSRSRSKSQDNKKQSKKHKKYSSQSRSSSSSSSSSNNDTKSNASQKTQTSTKSATSQYYEDYLKKKLGTVMIKDDTGTIKVDYGLQKRLHKQYQNSSKIDRKPMTEEEKQQQIEQMKNNANKLKEDKLLQNKKDYASDYIKISNNQLSSQQTKPKFLNEINNQIYNSNNNTSNIDLSDRLQRNRNNLTRLGEETNTFK